MKVFNESVLNEIRSRLDIVDWVSEHLSLKKAGQNFKGLCPFHSEKTPSFVVSQQKQIFHCFGCHEGGDLFTFLMKVEKLSFPEAIEKLADKAGVTLEQNPSSPRISKDEQEALFQANRWAAWYYYETLKKSPLAEPARAYLQKRGMGTSQIDRFYLGFSISNPTGLIALYEEKKIPLEAALKTGILRKGERSYYEGFRGRIIFPIFNRENKVIGLGGRITEGRSEDAKYINSPDSSIYDKSSNLFGLSLAREAMQKKKRLFLVEGYFDVITLHQYGFEETVAPLGTALTLKQIRLIKRYTDEIIILFDGDEAGWKATLRSLDLFLEQEIQPKVLILPEGEDPDSYLRKEGVQKFEQKIKETRNLLAVIIDKTLETKRGDISGKVLALAELKPHLLKITRPFERNLYLRKIAEGLEVPESWVFEELGLKVRQSGFSEALPKRSQARATVDEVLLEIYLKMESLRGDLLSKIDPHEFEGDLLRQFAQSLWTKVGASPLPLTEILSLLEEQSQRSLLHGFALRETPFDANSAMVMAKDCIEKIKARNIKQRLSRLTSEIKEAEKLNLQDQVLRLQKQKLSIVESLYKRTPK